MVDESHERHDDDSERPFEAELASPETPPQIGETQIGETQIGETPDAADSPAGASRDIQYLPPGPYTAGSPAAGRHPTQDHAPPHHVAPLHAAQHHPAPEPVALQAVVDEAARPHPFRFGTRAVFVLMAACGAQFALVFYLGALPGLLLGTATCMVVIGCLVVAAMVLHPRGKSRAMDVMDQLAIRLTLAVVILLLAVIVAGGGSLAWAEAVKIRRNATLQQDLGFTAQRQVFGRSGRKLAVDSIAPGKPFDQAGVLKGDEIVLAEDVDAFYEMLEASRGGEVTLTVVTGGSSAIAGQGRERELTVSVPPP